MKNLTVKCRRVLALLVAVGLLAGCSSVRSLLPDAEDDEQEMTTLYVPEEGTVVVRPPIPSTTSSASPVTGHTDEPGGSVLAAGGFAVSSSSKEATQTGMEILAAGGNAVDAAVAMAFTLGVAEPYSSGLGSSGFMVVYDPATGKGYSLDYRGCASSAYATKRDEVSVPGMVKGMETALDMWGTISLAEAMEPAIFYAENGFTASSDFITRLGYSSSLQNNPAFRDVSAGDTVIQSQLASTMRTIQTEGTSAFYTGKIAQDIVSCCSLTADDLANYQVYCEDALETECMGYRMMTSGAPSSGITVLQMMKMAEALDIPSPDADTGAYLTDLRSCTMRAYNKRASILVDPRYYDFDGAYYLSDEYISSMLAEQLSAAPEDNEYMCTTQYSVIDGNGMIVCVTNTLSDNWGTFQLVDGFYLNDTNTNFSSTGKNAYEAGKRSRTHIAPVIILGENGECFAVGSPGGNNIPRIIVPVMLDILKYGTDVKTAILKSRAMFDTDGALCLETEDDASSILNRSAIQCSYYWNSSHIYFGCTSVVGYSQAEGGVFGYCDKRRGTSQAMVYYYDS
ncbi:MAG: gamma-glutamyltransferase [Oscillospiraceae bacterium]|nr:gamma-glutamyltransferase [Oscillospiraceae bacterium]